MYDTGEQHTNRTAPQPWRPQQRCCWSTTPSRRIGAFGSFGAMSGIRVEHRVVISGGGLKAPVIVSETRSVDGTEFFKVAKADRVLERILCSGRSSSESRPLSRTDIIETLTMARNKKVNELILGNSLEEGKEDLGLDAPKSKRPRQSSITLPTVIEIRGPTAGSVVGIPLKVLPDPATKPLWVELTTANLEYLIAVVAAQRESGDIKRHHPRLLVDDEQRVDLTRAPGISYSYRRSAIRATAKGEAGQSVTRYFKVKPETTIQEQEAEASAWVSQASSGSAAPPLCDGNVQAEMPPLMDGAAASDSD